MEAALPDTEESRFKLMNWFAEINETFEEEILPLIIK